MFKIDKNTHLLILFTFALIFLVVYLYYTIVDVRKMQRDIKNLSDEVSGLKTVAATCKMAGGGACPLNATNKPQQVIKPQVPVAAEVVTVSVCSAPISGQSNQGNTTAEKPKATFVIEDDDESVQTDEIRNALDCTDDEDDVVATQPATQSANDAPPTQTRDFQFEAEDQITSQIVTDNSDSVPVDSDVPTDLSKLKYEDLRELCKKLNVNPKGSKDVLLKRLSEMKK